MYVRMYVRTNSCDCWKSSTICMFHKINCIQALLLTSSLPLPSLPFPPFPSSILPEHAVVVNEANDHIVLCPQNGAKILLNGRTMEEGEKEELHHNDRYVCTCVGWSETAVGARRYAKDVAVLHNGQLVKNSCAIALC